MIGVASFFLSSLLWKKTSEKNKARIAEFYETMHRPVDTEKEGVGSEDVGQLKMVGMMSMVVGAGLFVVVFFPNSMIARGVIAATAASIFVVGALMHRAGCRSIAKTKES